MIKKITISLFFILAFNFIEGQNKEIESNPFIIDKYSKLIETGFILNEIENKELGYAYYNNNQYKNSLPYLLKIFSDIEEDNLHFMLNHAYKANNQFENGNLCLDKYYTRRKKEFDKYSEDLELLKSIGNRYLIKKIKKINTDHSELFNYEDENFIYYSSDEKKNTLKEKKSIWNNNYFYNEYKLSKKDSVVYNIRDINTNYHDSNIVYSLDKTFGFITSNEINKNAFYSKTNVVQLSIYKLIFNPKGELIDKIYLPFNSIEYSCKNPFYDANTKLLYFSSNMANGRGGYDIYSYDFDKNRLRNITEINSMNDENDAFVDAKKNIYFSSNGYYGFGGLDIFELQYDKDTKGYKRVMNIGLPVNSNQDDFGFYIKEKKGFYTTKRNLNDDIYSLTEIKDLDLDNPYYILQGNLVNNIDSESIDLSLINIKLISKKNDTINLNINSNLSFDQKLIENEYNIELIENDDYELITKKIVLNSEKFSTTNQNIYIKKKPCMNNYSGTVINSTQNTPIETYVFISDLEQNVIANTLTNEKGNYKISVPCGKNYVLTTVYDCKKPYLPNYIEYLKPTDEKHIIRNINLKEVSMCGLLVNEKGKLLIETKPILFASNKYVITDIAKIELEKVLAILNYDQNFNLIVNSHTDNQGKDENNMILSENRAKSTVAYLISKGLSKERISYFFFGESTPLIDCQENCSVLELSKNRRSEFELVEKK